MTRGDRYSVVLKIIGLYFFIKFLQHFMDLFFMVIKYEEFSDSSDSKTIDLNLGNREDRRILLKEAGSYLEFNRILDISLDKFHCLIDPLRDE